MLTNTKIQRGVIVVGVVVGVVVKVANSSIPHVSKYYFPRKLDQEV